MDRAAGAAAQAALVRQLGTTGLRRPLRFAGAALANVFIWSQTLLYPYYRAGDARVGLNPLSDQNVAGAVMMIEQMLLTIGLLAWLFFRLAAQDEARQQLLDFAAERGRPLSDERATRPAAAGTTAQLRERLLAEQEREPPAPQHRR
jgi:hypothetical protein